MKKIISLLLVFAVLSSLSASAINIDDYELDEQIRPTLGRAFRLHPNFVEAVNNANNDESIPIWVYLSGNILSNEEVKERYLILLYESISKGDMLPLYDEAVVDFFKEKYLSIERDVLVISKLLYSFEATPSEIINILNSPYFYASDLFSDEESALKFFAPTHCNAPKGKLKCSITFAFHVIEEGYVRYGVNYCYPSEECLFAYDCDVPHYFKNDICYNCNFNLLEAPRRPGDINGDGDVDVLRKR